jgi:hypothetical protein
LKRSEFENEFESSSESDGRTTRRNVARNDVRGINTSTCQQLVDIIGGMVIQATLVYVVMRLRNKNATILGHRTRSLFSFAICPFL